MADARIDPNAAADPAKYMLTPTSASRLAAQTGFAAEKLAGLTIAAIAKQYTTIDPRLLFLQKICGTVVKTDPATGIDYPVPFATVQVEDTDCSFLGYFPGHAPWGWYFPFRCHREVIATGRTDACGNFCVWVPRWDIDWVVHYRVARKCYPIIFERPNLREIIDTIIPQVVPRGPTGGPGPLNALDRNRIVARIAESFGHDVAVRAARLQTPAGFGTSTLETDAGLDMPALLPHIRPPLPPELRLPNIPPITDPNKKGGIDPHPVVTTLANRLSLNPADLKALDLRRYIGPFKRCFDIVFPEWTPIIDVPDITFKVLQDTNGDGVEEQVYGEGYFQVRWNTTNLGPVTLHAGPNALAGSLCGPTVIPCGNAPAIVTAGRLPVTGDPLTYDSATGYALRTNRPHPSGLYSDPLPLPAGQAPLAGVLSLYGCNKTAPSATKYRLMYRYSADYGVTFTSPSPFLNMPFPLYRLNGVGIGEWYNATSDAQGWYAIALPPGPNPWLPQDLLVDWPSQGMPNGLYAVTLQLGTGGGSVLASSAEVAFAVDNSQPTGPFTVETATSAAGPFTPIDGICPVVRRGVVPHDVYLRVTLTAAAAHLRSVAMDAYGCGSGLFVFVSGTGGSQASLGSTAYQHWHTSPSDNDQVLQVIYLLPAGAAEGTYSVGGVVSGRQFSPSGYDGGELAVPPWQYDPDYSYITPNVAFSVFNSN